MKSFIFVLPVLCIILFAGTGCKREQQVKTNDRAASATIIIPANPTLSGVLGTGPNIQDTIRLTSNVTWRLSGLAYVAAGDVLIIDSCTTIKGNLSPTAGVPGGGLVICRGAKILAKGTCSCPIVFTSAAANPKPGDWSGIIILGNASSNHSGRVQVEGIPSNPPANATFGGTADTNDNDNSGIFSYVRIEYAGFSLSLNNEINSLTLAGVGRGTQIDHICIYKSNDDAFEWFGGTVNASYLMAVDPLDDMFDTDNGYRGTIQYALGLADTTRADQSQSNGLECDNDAFGTTATPVSHPIFKNITLVGLPANSPKINSQSLLPSGTGKYGRAAHFRQNTEFEISCAIVLGWNFGISIDEIGTLAKYQANHAAWLHNTVSHGHNSAGTPVLISRYVTETNGNPVTGTGFDLTHPAKFYNYATILDGNLAASTSSVGLPDPFTRTVANLTATPGTAADATACGGAQPNTWVCSPWARIQ